MIEVYKIIHNIYDHESVPNILRNNDISQRTGNTGHSLKLVTKSQIKPKKKTIFPIRITEPWSNVEAQLRITNNRTGTQDLY